MISAMAGHPPMVRFLMLAPTMVAIIFIALGISAIARRRGLARLRRMRLNQGVAVPVTVRPPRRSGSVRRYVWGVVVVLVVLAAVTQTVSVHTASVSRLDTASGQWEWIAPDGPLSIARADSVRAASAKPAPITHKPKIWFKPERPAAVDPGPKWQATIEQNRFTSEQKVNPRTELLSKIAEKLESDLHLNILPPPEFVATPAWVRIVSSETTTLKEDPSLGELQSIVTEVELTPDGWHELGRLEQADRASNRMEVTLRGLGLLTLLLGAVAAYIRLDDWTKGYYSGRLFLLATLIVGGVGIFIIHP